MKRDVLQRTAQWYKDREFSWLGVLLILGLMALGPGLMVYGQGYIRILERERTIVQEQTIVPDQGQELIQVVGQLVDHMLTEQRLEEELLQAQRLVMLGLVLGLLGLILIILSRVWFLRKKIVSSASKFKLLKL